MKCCARVFSLCLLVLLTANTFADPILPTLPFGTQYRVAFVTSTFHPATSTNIADYNGIIASAANTQPILQGLGTTWTAIGSTATVNAIDNTATSGGGGVPIYLLDGSTLIANDYTDLWDGTIQNPLNVDETGAVTTVATIAFTGTQSNGTAFTGSELGTGGFMRTGSLNASNSGWISIGSTSGDSRIYGISGTLSAVPEPNAMLCLGMVAIGIFTKNKWFSRKRS